jgi:D-alanyl-D-alanine carboxypeptidase (penicillin-binding protein 5/6)
MLNPRPKAKGKRQKTELLVATTACLLTFSFSLFPFALSARPAFAQADLPDEGAEPEEPLPAPNGQPPTILARSAILVDARTGTILFEKDAHTRRPPASTTKIMTATLLLEHAGLDRPVVASLRAAHTPYGLHLRLGEVLSMHDMLYAILLRSANDGCVAAAEAVAGSVPEFVEMMNYKAKEIGCTDTHFVTPNGLYAREHYSSAADLARMAIYATQYPLFNEIVGTRDMIICRSMDRADCLMRNHNRLLARYPGCDGIKTGYVHQSGKCLVASATRQEAGQPWRLISVVLNSSNIYRDSAALLNYGFAHFHPVSVASKGEQVGSANVDWGKPRAVPALAAADMTVVVPRRGIHRVERHFSLLPQKAPLRSGSPLGQVTATLDGQPVASVLLCRGQPAPGVALVSGERVNRDWVALSVRFASAPLALVLLVGLAPKYARTLTKGPRRRRRRLSPRRRRDDLVWQGSGRRPASYRAWDES